MRAHQPFRDIALSGFGRLPELHMTERCRTAVCPVVVHRGPAAAGLGSTEGSKSWTLDTRSLPAL